MATLTKSFIERVSVVLDLLFFVDFTPGGYWWAIRARAERFQFPAGKWSAETAGGRTNEQKNHHDITSLPFLLSALFVAKC